MNIPQAISGAFNWYLGNLFVNPGLILVIHLVIAVAILAVWQFFSLAEKISKDILDDDIDTFPGLFALGKLNAAREALCRATCDLYNLTNFAEVKSNLNLALSQLVGSRVMEPRLSSLIIKLPDSAEEVKGLGKDAFIKERNEIAFVLKQLDQEISRIESSLPKKLIQVHKRLGLLNKGADETGYWFIVFSVISIFLWIGGSILARIIG